jgi:hypothetical protein
MVSHFGPCNYFNHPLWELKRLLVALVHRALNNITSELQPDSEFVLLRIWNKENCKSARKSETLHWIFKSLFKKWLEIPCHFQIGKAWHSSINGSWDMIFCNFGSDVMNNIITVCLFDIWIMVFTDGQPSQWSPDSWKTTKPIAKPETPWHPSSSPAFEWKHWPWLVHQEDAKFAQEWQKVQAEVCCYVLQKLNKLSFKIIHIQLMKEVCKLISMLPQFNYWIKFAVHFKSVCS